MAKMDKKHQKQTDEAAGGFEPLPDGAYHLRLNQVDSEREGPSGPYWSWEFDVVEPGDYTNRKLWNNTSLSEAAAFKMKETYDAFGVPYDTDTDDMCGQVVKAIVSIRTIQSGARKGEPSNQIDKLVPKDPDFEVPEGAGAVAAGGQPKSDDLF